MSDGRVRRSARGLAPLLRTITTEGDGGLEHLKGLTDLEYLVLKRTDVTAAGVKKLQETLPKCRTGYAPRP